MERFVHMSLDDLDLLVSGDGCELEDVAYPPRCNPPRGPLRVRAHDRGGIKLEVSRRRLPLDDFVLSVLFQTGRASSAGARISRASSAARSRRRSGSRASRFHHGSRRSPRTSRRKPTTSRRCPGVRPRARAARRAADSVRARGPHCAAHPRTGRRGRAGCAGRRDAPGEGATGAALRACSSPGRPAPARPRPSSCCLARWTSSGTPARKSFASTAGELVHASDLRRVLGAPPSTSATSTSRRSSPHCARRVHPPPRRDREGGRGGARRLPRPARRRQAHGAGRRDRRGAGSDRGV